MITAIAETVTCSDGRPANYTSARINTRNKHEDTYGCWEARIRLLYGQGMWPAFWMLGDNTDGCGSHGWPSYGEIGIFENIGREPSTIHSGIHGPGYSSGRGCSYTLPDGQVFSSDFHIFAMEWESDEVINFYVDENLCGTLSSANLPPGTTWIFNHPFDVLLNVAVGGNWPGPPDSTTIFPQKMLVDYVRVFNRSF